MASGGGAPDGDRPDRAARRRAEREARRAERRRRTSGADEAERTGLPDLPLLLPSLAGVALAGYLALVAWTGGTPAACAAGSSCDLVQGSRFGSFAGVPTAAWGLLAYAALAAIAAGVRNARWHAGLALAVAGPGLAISLYLTGVSIFAIGATCLWCLASLVLMALCFAAAWRGRPQAPAEPLSPGFLPALAGGALLVVVGLHLHFQGVFDPALGPERPRVRALAEHLEASGARFYGASWCPHCQDQKAIFGTSAHRLPYVECSPEGPRGPLAPACAAAGVQSYPTWIIDGERHEGMLSLAELARLSGFRTQAPADDASARAEERARAADRAEAGGSR